jgi:SSS family solute:Na+ symporter
VVLFVFFAGFAAVLTVPGLTGSDADLSLLRVSKQTFSSWTVGLIGAAGLLTALVPGSMILITTTTIIAQNLYRAAVPTATDRTVARVARGLVPVIALIAAVMALKGGAAIVSLLLMGYNFVTQLFPGLLLSLGNRPRVSRSAVFAGIVAGEATVAYLSITNTTVAALLPAAPQVFKDLNVGIVALLVNLVVTAIVTLMVRTKAVGDLAPNPVR